MVTWSSLPLLQLTSILHQHRTRRHPSKGFRTTVIQRSVLQYNFVVLQFCCSCAERLSLTHVGMLAQALAVTDPFWSLVLRYVLPVRYYVRRYEVCYNCNITSLLKCGADFTGWCCPSVCMSVGLSVCLPETQKLAIYSLYWRTIESHTRALKNNSCPPG